MNRPIKFRAWNTTKADWTTFKTCIDTGAFEAGGVLIPARDVILMQYTGLKDKNGVEIYEGDIVEQRNDIAMLIGGPYEVRWGVFGFTLFDPTQPEVGSRYVTPSQLVVVGNVYENPDLLEPKS